MFSILLVIQILVSVAIISLVMLQHGKGADMGAAFGSGSSGTVFGARGSGSFLTRATAVLAAIFFINCLLIASPLLRQKDTGEGGVVEQLEQQAQQQRQAEKPVVVKDKSATSPAPEAGTAAEKVPAAASDLPEVIEEAKTPLADTKQDQPDAARQTPAKADTGTTGEAPK